MFSKTWVKLNDMYACNQNHSFSSWDYFLIIKIIGNFICQVSLLKIKIIQSINSKSKFDLWVNGHWLVVKYYNSLITYPSCSYKETQKKKKNSHWERQLLYVQCKSKGLKYV